MSKINIEKLLVESSVRADQERIDNVRERLFARPHRRAPPYYELREELGRGQFGRVCRAFDRRGKRDVALKLINARSAQQRARIVREAEALARLSHPNVVSLYEHGAVDDRTHYLALEYVEGVSLARWLEHERSLGQILRVFAQTARALQAVHQERLVHRGFKPANVIVGDDGRVRLLDFGLARLVDDRASSREACTTRPSSASGSELDVTDPGPGPRPEPTSADGDRSSAVGPWLVPEPGGAPEPSNPDARQAALSGSRDGVGSLAYASPEQLESPPVDTRSDQFSFCVALYEAVYGARSFSGLTVSERRAEGLTPVAGWSMPRARGARVPRWLRRLLLRGLAPSPEQRHDGFTSLIAAIEAHLGPRVVLRRIAWFMAGLMVAALALAWRPQWTTIERPWAQDRQGFEQRYGAGLLAELEIYASRWREEARTWSPLGAASVCLRVRGRAFSRFAQDLAAEHGTRRLDIFSVLHTRLLLSYVLDPGACVSGHVAPEDTQAAILGFLLEAHQDGISGDYEAALSKLEQAHAQHDPVSGRLRGMIDATRGAFELRLGRHEAWYSLDRALYNAQTPEFAAAVLGMKIRAGVMAKRPAADLVALRDDLARYQASVEGSQQPAHAVLRVDSHLTLGTLALHLSQARVAIQHYERASRIVETSFTPELRELWLAFVQLQRAYALLRDPQRREQAADDAQQALHCLTKILDERHPALVAYTNGVAAVLEQLDRGDDALAYWRAGLARAERQGGSARGEQVRASVTILFHEVLNTEGTEIGEEQARAWARQASELASWLHLHPQALSPVVQRNLWARLTSVLEAVGELPGALRALARWHELAKPRDTEEPCDAFEIIVAGLRAKDLEFDIDEIEISRRLASACMGRGEQQPAPDEDRRGIRK